MTVAASLHALVPGTDERRRARTWLLPWGTERRWWAWPLGLMLGLGAFRAVLLLVSHRAWFMPDTPAYLELVDELFVPRTRPPGVAVFWSGVLGVWTSLYAILLAHALLGVLTGLLVFLVAREVGLPAPAAAVAAAVGCYTPMALFFERVLLTETLSVFLVVATFWLVLVGVRTRAAAPWMCAGVVGALGVLVRTAVLPLLLVTTVLAVVLTHGSVLARAKVSIAFVLGIALPLVGYGFATFVDTRAATGQGHFGLQFTDGFAWFVSTAPLTDCSDPGAPPAIRRRICAIPGYLDRDPDVISWAPGPVKQALDSPQWIARNDDLRELAVENIRRDPLGALELAGGRAVRLFSTYDNGYSTDGGPMAPQLEAVGLAVPTLAGGVERVWLHARDIWAIGRWLLWGALVAAVCVAPRRWDRGGRTMMFVVIPPLVTIVWLGLAVTAVARYLFPYEWVGAVALVWLLAPSVERRSARRDASG